MASITYDGQSFLIEGRRIWLVGGTINYTSLAREQWAPRLHQARLAGFNTVTTSVHWARHEPRPGHFDFTADADLKHFVSLVGQMGLHCILRLGPFVGAGLDLGGLPPWLLMQKDAAVRTVNGPYLEAASRFFGAVAKQVRDLQITAATTAATGPIIAVQNEANWTVGHDTLAQGYLGELNRYIRESGFEVPILNANDLWSGVEGEIDTWSGSGELLPHLRQLATVRPQQPRIVSAVRIGRAGVWGGGTGRTTDGEGLQRTLCEALCAGAQFNLEPLVAGSHFGFWAGREEGEGGGFCTSSRDGCAPIDEAGRTTPLLAAARRVATFAARFGRVFSSLDLRRSPVTLRPAALDGSRGPQGPAIVHVGGAQGSVAFLFAAPGSGRGKGGDQPAEILLSDGASLPVYMGRNPVAWCVLDTRLFGRSHLDYSNLSAFALVGRVLVVAGPAGTPARLSINGAPLEDEVPTGDAPTVTDHEGITVVIAADEHLGRIQIADDAVYLNATGITPAGLPTVGDEGSVVTRISDQGVQTKLTLTPAASKPARPSAKGKKAPAPQPAPAQVVLAKAQRTPPAPAMAEWSVVATDDYASGTSPRFASIAGPADLTALGAAYGYGWYRIALKGATPARVHAAWPQGGHRLHIFLDGQIQGVLGEGAGAKEQVTLGLTRHPQSLVVLAENAGRFASGNRLAEGTGLLGHAWEVEPLRLSKPTLERADPFEPFKFKAPILGVSEGDATDPMRPTWKVNRRGKNPILVSMPASAARGVLFVNGVPVRWFDAHQPWRHWLDDAALGRGNVEFSMAILGNASEVLPELAAGFGGFEALENITAKGEWSFAKWERPGPDAYKPARSHRGDGPAWWRTTFATRAGAPPLRIVTTGLSKGQVYVNGRHLGRYFSSTSGGHDAGPHGGLLAPASWLKADAPNELVIFDEHGKHPGKVKIAFEV